MKGPIIFLIAFISVIFISLIVVKISSLRQYKLITRAGIFKLFDRFLILISIVGILVTTLWDFNYFNYSKSIPHEDWDKITLNDFKGLKMPKHNLDGETKFAFVSTSIKVKNHNNMLYVESFFHPCRSYVFNRRLFSNELLTHEMYHFHITEYCARLMKKEICDYHEYGIDYNLSKVKRHFMVYEQSLQTQYDDETYHSYVHGKQLEWQKKIDSLLTSVEDYSNPDITLN
jgi:hypothetical protein